MNLTQKLPAWIMGLLGLFLLGRGIFHYAAPDSGAGIVAGMDLSYPNGADIIFLLGAAGILQAALGVCYIYFATKLQQALGFAYWLEVSRAALFVFMEYTFKMPANPVPGRYGHISVLVVAIVGLLIYIYQNRSASSSSSG